MLSYQHGYHAGGPADVHKHVALSAVLGHLADKEKPFTVIDLYAGSGVYDLSSPEAQKTKEFECGIARVWPRELRDVPTPVHRLFSAIAALNPDGRLTWYPGSPALARAHLRPDDRLILNELHPTSNFDIGKWAEADGRITLHKRDGLEALVGLVPPQVRRGVVVIDPSYEVKSEYASVPEALRRALQRWREGIYFVWYPILPDARHQKLIDGLIANIDAEILACELSFERQPREEGFGLLGTGLAVVNPPWHFDKTMQEAGKWLAAHLGGGHSILWLKTGS